MALYWRCIYLMHQVSAVTSGEQGRFIPPSTFCLLAGLWGVSGFSFDLSLKYC